MSILFLKNICEKMFGVNVAIKFARGDDFATLPRFSKIGGGGGLCVLGTQWKK